MSSQVLLFIFLIVAIILAVDITRRAIFSILASNKERKLQVEMRRLRRPKEPWVTVLIYSKNQAVELEKTVRKIRKNRYGKFDIVALSDRSEDSTAVGMKRYINTTNRRVNIEFLQRRATGTKMDAYRAAYRKSQRGKIIICLTAGDEVSQTLLKQVVVSRADRQQWQVGTLAVTEPYGLIGIVKNFRMLFWRAGNASVAWAYTPAALRRCIKVNRRIQPALVFFCTQVLILAGIVVGVAFGGLIALWYAWILVSFYLLALIWIQYEIPASKKWKFTFTVPSALFLIPIVGLAEGLTQLHIRK